MGASTVLIALALLLVITFAGIMSRYRKCPSDKILVIYGKVGKSTDGDTRSARCIHGGASFIWPVIQSFEYMDLTPMSIEVNLTNALSKQNIRVDVPSRFTVGISIESTVMQNAAERLLGLSHVDVKELAKDILFGQLRLVIATMDIEEINSDRDKFLDNVSKNVEAELSKIGLKLINVNVTDIKDESGYIEALGKEAAAKAINDAKKSVAEKNRDGSIGEANAHRDERVSVAQANATALEGENKSKILVSQSHAARRQREAEALRLATASEKVQEAKALEEAYTAEKEAEIIRATREKATKEADVIVEAQIEKEKITIAAEAEAEKIRRHARGEADAILSKMEAEANGIYAILSKQAEGFGQIVGATNGDTDQAVQLMIADKLEKLVATQVEAIKGIKIDKVTVWDSGSGDKPATANFLSGMLKSLPPLNDVYKSAGLNLPNILNVNPINQEINKEKIVVETINESIIEDSNESVTTKE